MKRMFPKDKCLALLARDGSAATHVRLTMTNVMSAISVPDSIDLGGLSSKDIAAGISIKINGTDVAVTEEMLKTGVSLIHGGKEYTWNDIFVGNKAAGVTIAIGDKLGLAIKMNDQIKSLAKPGNVDIDVSVNIGGSTNIKHSVDLSDKVLPWSLDL